MPLRSPLLAAALLALALAAHATADPGLATHAERSGFIQTGRYDEVIALCERFAVRHADAVRCIDFGVTPEGRPMKALVASRTGALTAQDAARRGLPVVLVQGGIHAGEIDGKDAGFLVLREALEGRRAKGTLDKLVLVFVPVFNVDGHERFGRWNRPNQRGPEEMGWRTTARNYNLNRDYAKADTPEMQAMLRLVQAWDPIAIIDLHVTNGAQFEHDISIQVEPVTAGDDALRAAGRALREGVIADLARQGSLPLPFYPSLVITDDPTSGFADDVPAPRFSSGYFWLRNRFGMLVETHAWKDYPTRVRITANTVVSVLEHAAANGERWLALARAADQRAAGLGGEAVALEFTPSDKTREIDFRGYAYTRKPSEVSGALMTRYDESTPQVWRVPLRDDLQPSFAPVAPGAGYLVPAAHAAWVGEKLALHGIAFRRLETPPQTDRHQSFRATHTAFGPQSFEGRQRLTLKGKWAEETTTLAAGALFVPIAQPKARLAMALLEPEASDSLAAWGFFNTAFEPKEYMEAYVAEDVAREQLRDPAVAAEFARRLATDPEFAGSPEARLQFFHRRHASWDQRYNLYPILRTSRAPE